MKNVEGGLGVECSSFLELVLINVGSLTGVVVRKGIVVLIIDFDFLISAILAAIGADDGRLFDSAVLNIGE